MENVSKDCCSGIFRGTLRPRAQSVSNKADRDYAWCLSTDSSPSHLLISFCPVSDSASTLAAHYYSGSYSLATPSLHLSPLWSSLLFGRQDVWRHHGLAQDPGPR